MKIILDTNVFTGNPHLDSGVFRVLIQQARQARAKIIVPRIVFQELRPSYRREVEESWQKFSKAQSSVSRWLTPMARPKFSIDIDSAVESLMRSVHDVLDFVEDDLEEYKANYLGEVIDRAANRRPPCNAKGEEIRDAVVWLTVVDTALASSDKTVIFISNDGGFSSGTDLKDELQAECTEKGITVQFFKNLELFAKHYAERVAMITPEWIQQRVPSAAVLMLAESEIDEIALDLARDEAINESKPNAEYRPTGYVNQTASELRLKDFFVNELDDGSLRIEAKYAVDVTASCDMTVQTGYREGRFARPGTSSWQGMQNTTMLSFSLCLDIIAEILVANGEVTDYRMLKVVLRKVFF